MRIITIKCNSYNLLNNHNRSPPRSATPVGLNPGVVGAASSEGLGASTSGPQNPEGPTRVPMSRKKPLLWVCALLLKHGIITPAWDASYFSLPRRSGRQWPLPEDCLPNPVVAGLIYPPVRLEVDIIPSYQKAVEKFSSKAQVQTWHQLRGLYKLGYLPEYPESQYAKGMDYALRGIWNEDTWANVINTLCDHLKNSPASNGWCWFTDLERKGGHTRTAPVNPRHRVAEDGEQYGYPRVSVTFGTYRKGEGKYSGTRFLGEKLASGSDPKVARDVHRIGWSLGHPTEVRVRSVGDRTSQADHACRDHSECFNPWHLPTGADKSNKARVPCRRGFARVCPCWPQCWFTDEVTGAYFPCLNNPFLSLRDVARDCTHNPNCFDSLDKPCFRKRPPVSTCP